MDQVWDIFCEELCKTNKEFELNIHSFVLMSNHFHLIASTPKANISDCMRQFMYRTSRRLTRKGNRINQTYSGRHYKCILQHHNYFLNAYKYNYRNPIAAGICTEAQNYKYSTLYNLVRGESLSMIPIIEDLTYLSDPVGTLKWVNTPINSKKIEALKHSFRHTHFKCRKNRNTQTPFISEHEIL